MQQSQHLLLNGIYADPMSYLSPLILSSIATQFIAFQVVNPPNSVPTDISLSQYLSIQEKGVSAWEFEPSYDHQLYVHDRTELSFFDRVASVQTNLPLPKQQEVYYWEVKMFEKSPRTTIAIGVATKPYPSTRLPGTERYSGSIVLCMVDILILTG
jgi:hypothetical protein